MFELISRITYFEGIPCLAQIWKEGLSLPSSEGFDFVNSPWKALCFMPYEEGIGRWDGRKVEEVG